MMLVMLAVAWPLTGVCDHHDARDRDERDLGSGGSSSDGGIFTSRVARIPYSSRVPVVEV